MENTIKKIREKYIEITMIHGDASAGGNNRKANRYLKKLVAILKEIREAGESGHQLLIELLDYEEEYVALAAETHLLFSDTEKAIETFNRLNRDDNFYVGETADLTLRDFEDDFLNYNKDYFY